jgi:hypothetical protein
MLHELFSVAMLELLSEVIVYVNVTWDLFSVAMLELLKIMSEVIVYVNVTWAVFSHHVGIIENIEWGSCLCKCYMR